MTIRWGGPAPIVVGLMTLLTAACGAGGQFSMPLTWSKPTVIDRKIVADEIGLGDGMTDVSCVGASFCMAVDGLGNAAAFDGRSWVLSPTGDAGLQTVSCASSTFCVAGDAKGSVVEYNGASWGPPVTVDPGGTFEVVSCGSTRFCIAVDSSREAFLFDGTAWTRVSVAKGLDGIGSISCPSSTFCMAITGNGDAVSYNGHSWSTPAPIASISPGTISCASAQFCVAAGWTQTKYQGTGRAIEFNGSRWLKSTVFDPNLDLSWPFFTLSCAGPSTCVIAEELSGDVYGFNGKSWSAPLDLDPALYNLETVGPAGVSCVSSHWCVVVDDGGNAFVGRD